MAKIYCFSSTGNSLHIAKTLAKYLPGEVVSMSAAPQTCEDEVIGFVFPVYYWGLPKCVVQFIQDLQINAAHPYIFALPCYGGKALGVLGQVGQLLRAKGLQLAYGKYIRSVENYILDFATNNEEEVHKIQAAETLTACADIAYRVQEETDDTSLESRQVYQGYPGHKGDCDRNFLVEDGCTGCGVCAGICPSHNIAIQEGRPVFQHHCQHCIACLHACPAAALQWQDRTQGKARYRNPHIPPAELIQFCGGH